MRINLIQALNYVLEIIPRIISIITHYNELISKSEVTDEDRERAKQYLEGLKWKKWDDIK